MTKKVRLSESALHQLMQGGFVHMDMSDWREIPYSITNSVSYSRATADAVFHMISDLYRLEEEKVASYTIKIFDMGCGIGRHAFYFLQHLNELLAKARYHDVNLSYVLFDISATNIDFCKEHPKLQSYFSSGQLEVVCGSHTKLLSMLKELSSTSVIPVLLANYFFDALPQDGYEWRDGVWCDVLFDRHVGDDQANLSPREFERQMSYKPVEFPVYEDARIDQALQAVLSDAQESERFLWPIEAIRLMLSLNDHFERVCFLVSDYGFTNHRENSLLDRSFMLSSYVEFSFFPIQFDYLRQIVKSLGGWYEVPIQRKRLLQTGGMVGRHCERFSLFRYALNRNANTQAISHNMHGAIWLSLNTTRESQLAFMAMLERSCFDPDYFEKFRSYVIENYGLFHDDIKALFASSLYAIADNYYQIESVNHTTLIAIVDCLVHVGAYERAFEMIDMGLHLYGRLSEFIFLKGKVLFLTESYVDAIEWFDRSIQQKYQLDAAHKFRTLCLSRVVGISD